MTQDEHEVMRGLFLTLRPELYPRVVGYIVGERRGPYNQHYEACRRAAEPFVAVSHRGEIVHGKIAFETIQARTAEMARHVGQYPGLTAAGATYLTALFRHRAASSRRSWAVLGEGQTYVVLRGLRGIAPVALGRSLAFVARDAVGAWEERWRAWQREGGRA